MSAARIALQRTDVHVDADACSSAPTRSIRVYAHARYSRGAGRGDPRPSAAK